jgi:hypothetical protein
MYVHALHTVHAVPDLRVLGDVWGTMCQFYYSRCRPYGNHSFVFAYSFFASISTGMSLSASFQKAKKS